MPNETLFPSFSQPIHFQSYGLIDLARCIIFDLSATLNIKLADIYIEIYVILCATPDQSRDNDTHI